MGPGQRPFVQRDWPSWIYKGGRPESGLGPHTIVDSLIIEQHEYESYRARGYRRNPKEAVELVDQQQEEFARLAAEINFEQKNKLSEKASAEVDAARAVHSNDVSGHMPMVPVTPIKPRGKKDGE